MTIKHLDLTLQNGSKSGNKDVKYVQVNEISDLHIKKIIRTTFSTKLETFYKNLHKSVFYFTDSYLFKIGLHTYSVMYLCHTFK